MEENKERNIVWKPQPRQLEFMRRPEPEALYGGAAGGGKSDALVIEALRQVHIPHYRALILRKTYPQLSDLHESCVGLPQRGEDLFRLDAAHERPDELSGQGLRLYRLR